ncbi:ERAP1-like C-terminal domain-containing protein [Nonomuraea sp. NPDC048892]|uniref:ERAP1-like C-terminal domain-containing protein n=1 Tax=Nonomuraea sp. NPDC048892 TaxID=3154624 RepID=UPI0033C1C4C4
MAPYLDADELFEITRQCFDRYHEKFDEPYPFDSYDQAFVPEFNTLAMENPGLVTFAEERLFRSAVTDTGQQAALLNFDGISYARGASALRQLVAWLGEKDFLAGINTHFARHKYANATLADFIDSLATSTQRDVHAWADSWLRTTGVDTLTPAVTPGDNGTYALTVGHAGDRPHRVAVGLYDRDLGDDEGRLALRERLDIDVPQTGAQPIGERPALLLLNDGDLTYAKVRFDPGSLDTVHKSLAGLPDPLTRAVVWNALRDGELAAAAYLETALAHLPHETDPAIVQGVLAFASAHIADRYLPADERPAALNTLSALCSNLIHRTGGDNPGLRLIAVRHFIDVAAHSGTIAGWLTDGTVPGGPELRWRILARLAVLGAADEAAIAAELRRDPSATGQEGAARCRAALLDEEAKAKAWEAMFATDAGNDLSNYLFTATAQGFWQPEQLDLLLTYVPRYYPDAIALAARRGPAIAKAAAKHAFPIHAINAETLRLGQECLSNGAPTPMLRRGLADQLDDLARALRVRER